MAHYLAEKMDEVEKAEGAHKEQASQECSDLILRIWDHRHSLPDGARPLAQFEPLFRTLEGLAESGPRNGLFRSAPRPQGTIATEAEELLAAAVSIDSAATSLIRYFLADAVSKVPAADKRWVKLRAAAKPNVWDIQIILRVIDDSVTFADKGQQLKESEIKKVKEMLNTLDGFHRTVAALKLELETRLAGLSSA